MRKMKPQRNHNNNNKNNNNKEDNNKIMKFSSEDSHLMQPNKISRISLLTVEILTVLIC